TIEGGKIVISDGIVNEMVLESGKLTGGRIVGTEFSGVTGEFEGKLIAGGDNRIEIEDGEIKFYSGNTSWHSINYRRGIPIMGTYVQARNGDVRDNRYGFYSFPKIITETKNITITSGTAGYAQRIDGLRLTGYDLDIRYLGGVFV